METLEEAAEKASDREGFVDGALFGAKWQQEQDKNKYSEEEKEECYRILHHLMTEIALNGLKINDDMDLKKWFEQFKKK